ncbi:MAG: sulfite exporter TauE/SafE family protein [Pseudomonadota bacterium]
MIELLLPEHVTLGAAGILVFASFFTSALTAAAGIGGGLLMLAIMIYLLPIGALIPVHGLVQLGSNASRTWVQRAHINWRIAFIFLIGSTIGALLGVLLAVQIPEGYLLTFLGLFVLIMVWFKLPALENASPGFVGLGGLGTTFVSMFVGATGPLVAVFLKNLFTKHRELVSTHAATMTAQHGIKIVAFILAGFAFYEWLPLVAAIIASGFLGVQAGTRLMNTLSENALQFLFKTTLTLVALDLVRQGLNIPLIP